MTEIGQVLELLSLKLDEERLQSIFCLLEGEGLIVVPALLPSEITGVDHLALIPLYEDHSLLGVSILEEELILTAGPSRS